MDTSFDQNKFDLAYSDGVEKHYWSVARNRIIISSLRANNLTGNNLIEIGCGRGFVVKYLSQKGVNCFGVESAEVKPLDETNVITGKKATDLADELSKKFQTVMLLDVIEHIEDPVGFLNDILAHFRNATSIVITVPARQELWSNYDEFYGHFRRYDLKAMEKTIEDIGFEIKELRYLFHSLYLPAKITLGLFKKRQIKMSAPKGLMTFIHKIIAAFIIFETTFLPDSWRGTSILCIATRRSSAR